MSKTIVDFEIDSDCAESFPCRHDVKVHYDDGTTEDTMYNGPKIYNLLKTFGKPMDPHFERYKGDRFKSYY